VIHISDISLLLSTMTNFDWCFRFDFRFQINEKGLIIFLNYFHFLEGRITTFWLCYQLHYVQLIFPYMDKRTQRHKRTQKTYTYTHSHMYTRTYTNSHTQTHTYPHIHNYIHTHTNILRQVRVRYLYHNFYYAFDVICRWLQVETLYFNFFSFLYLRLVLCYLGCTNVTK